MSNFTPLSSLVGGLLVGLAAASLWWLQGRICGISGILGRTLRRRAHAERWRLWFLLGLLLSGIVLSSIYPARFAVAVERSSAALIGAGVLVGFGTQLGNGCTSGHGVCGLGRASGRSLVATLCFMASGAVTAAVVTHLLGGSL